MALIRTALTNLAICAVLLLLLEVGLRYSPGGYNVSTRLNCTTHKLADDYSSIYLAEISSKDGWRIYAENGDGNRDTIATGKRKILVLGDSQTYGLNVNQNQNFADVLDQSLPEIEFTNMASPGLGTVDQFFQYRDLAPDRRDELVILGFFGYNDVYDNIRFPPSNEAWRASAELRDGIVHYLRPTLEKKPDPSDLMRLANSLHVYVFFRTLYRLAHWLLWEPPKTQADFDAMISRAVDLTVAVLGDLRREVLARKARLLIVSIPGNRETLNGAYEPKSQAVLSRLSSASQPFFVLDMLPIFAQQPTPAGLYAKGDFHVNERGQRVIASSIAVVLREAGIVNSGKAGKLSPAAPIDSRLEQACAAHKAEYRKALQF